MSRLQLDGPLFAWSDTALAATLGDGDAARPVIAFLGPDTTIHDGDDTDEGRGLWINRRHPGLLTLLDVVEVGARSAWVHERVDALGLIHLVDCPESQRVPLRVAAELVAAVADLLHGIGPDAVQHPGPAPEDLGLTDTGAVSLVGFGSPWPPAPAARDPSGGAPAESLVWRLGVLLAQLLGGRIPAVSDRSAHEAMLRRVLIRAMSRSGPIFSERYRDWLSGLLSWDADQRPPLSSIGPGLREVGARLGGPDLAAWAEVEVARRIAVVKERSELLEVTQDADASYHPWNVAEASEDGPSLMHPSEMSGTRTLPGIPLSQIHRDDVTAESTLVRDPSIPVAPRLEPGTIPVSVGPPAEAMRKRPSLPHHFLDGPAQDEPIELEPSPALFARLFLLALLGGVIAGLVVLLAVFLAVRGY